MTDELSDLKEQQINRNNNNNNISDSSSSWESVTQLEGACAAANPPINVPLFRGLSLNWLCPSVEFSEISFKEKVGHGSYGVVYKAFWRKRYVAVKEFGPKAEQKAIITEVKQLSRVQHPNIIALYGIASNQMSTYLLMEYAEGGSLYDLLHGKVKPKYSPAHAMSWALQCAEGVAYLHAMKPKPLIHRDLKPLNLLLTNKGRNLKICDFGTVADKATSMTNNKGSAAWMAPEVFEGSKYTEKCDIFSWGIVLWEVLSRQKPFKDVDNTYSIMWKIHKGERPPLRADFPEPLKQLMTSCWDTKPDSRPSMQFVVEVMNEMVLAFPGAEEPLEYEFINQQIVSSNSNDTTDDNITLDFSSYTSSDYSINSAQVTLQENTTASNSTSNASSHSDFFNSLANSEQIKIPSPCLRAPARWSAIPEESDETLTNDHVDNEREIFNLTASHESVQRYKTIRNNMLHYASVPMPPLLVDIDPHAWDLSQSDSLTSSAKSDGKERLTVTDAKPLLVADKLPYRTTQETSTVGENHVDDDDDEEEDSGQSWHEMLDPELQPEPPLPDNVESQEIYREHRRLAKEYLKVDTDLYFAQDYKEKCLQQLSPEDRQIKEELIKKMNEKEELLELYNTLKQQLDSLRLEQSTPLQQQQQQQQQNQSNNSRMDPNFYSNNNNIVNDDNWVVIQHNENV